MSTEYMPLDAGPDDVQAVEDAVVAFVNRFLETRPDALAVLPPATPDLIADLLTPPPAEGVPIDQILKTFDAAIETGFDTTAPGFLSYIPTGGLFTSALGSFLGAATNQYTGGQHAAPGAVAIEQSVIDWMTSLFGLPASSGGILLSGGSTANLTATVTARTRLGEDFGDGVVYTSERSHHSIEKAARIAGIASKRVRLVPVDDRLRMNPDALQHMVSSDVAQGLSPMMVVATAGTTDTGAIDPLGSCADIAARVGAWFHVDAAYGGFFQLTDRGRERFAGIDRADSITVDAHKSLFLPFGVGGLLVRDISTLVDAHSGEGVYMQDVGEGETPHFFQLGTELTRPYRGINVWLPLQLHGVDQFTVALDTMLDLAEWSAEALAGMSGIEVLTEPELSIVAFRSVEGDAASQRVFDHISSTRELHVSSTVIDGKLTLRLAFLSHRTSIETARRAIALIAEAV
jgi:aromatic-L-amino-acid decarboxylase